VLRFFYGAPVFSRGRIFDIPVISSHRFYCDSRFAASPSFFGVASQRLLLFLIPEFFSRRDAYAIHSPSARGV
jgi:hypothetical protein